MYILFEDKNEIINISEGSNFHGYLSRKAWELGYIAKNDELTHSEHYCHNCGDPAPTSRAKVLCNECNFGGD